jgi:hypothetical protein
VLIDSGESSTHFIFVREWEALLEAIDFGLPLFSPVDYDHDGVRMIFANFSAEAQTVLMGGQDTRLEREIAFNLVSVDENCPVLIYDICSPNCNGSSHADGALITWDRRLL